jgi:hypothetical protein
VSASSTQESIAALPAAAVPLLSSDSAGMLGAMQTNFGEAR